MSLGDRQSQQRGAALSRLRDILDDELIVNERLAREQIFKFMTDNNIAYVDSLPALKKSVGQELHARTAADMHPSKNGYRVIAEAISEHLKQAEKSS
jgi:lysophospholipase L1-like esterase